MSTHWRASDRDDRPAFDDDRTGMGFTDHAVADVRQDDFGQDDSSHDGFADGGYSDAGFTIGGFDDFDDGFGAFGPGGFEAGEAQAEVFDNGVRDDAGLVLAPLSIPAVHSSSTRWDALDGGGRNDAFRNDRRPSTGAGLYDDAAFGPAPAGTVVPGEYPAPLPVVSVAPTPIVPSPPSLLDDLYKLCARLTGVSHLAVEISREAIALATSDEAPLGDALTAMTFAVRRCLETAIPDESSVPYHQHRARLRRDLGRRIDRDRAILALRHIVGVPPSGVAARLGVPESQVRETASAWCPDDSRVDSLALLRGIDSWISSDLGSAAAAASGHELAHLDDTVR